MPNLPGLLVGMHRSRHVGGPGRLSAIPGGVELVHRRGRHHVRHRADVVRLERTRWEPPTGNHWFELRDGEVTAWVTASRRRALRVVALLHAQGLEIEVHGEVAALGVAPGARVPRTGTDGEAAGG